MLYSLLYCSLLDFNVSVVIYSHTESILIQHSPDTQTSLRDKAIAVAGRVSSLKNRESSKVSCPVCFNVLQTTGDADLKMTLALHLSLWHPDDVKLQWDVMHNRKESSLIHLPSVIIGVGMTAGFVALLAISAKNHRELPAKMRRRS
ncbi:hypothetical protein ACS0TY_035418 [Phlomoides rotata]